MVEFLQTSSYASLSGSTSHEQRKGTFMIDSERMKAGLQRELELLRSMREELRLQVTLAKADVRSEWERLESRFELAQEQLKRTREHSKVAVHDIESQLRTLVEELKRGYEAIRRMLQT